MRNLLLLALVASVFITGCYKEKQREDPFKVLTSTPWQIEAHTSVAGGYVTEPESQLEKNCGVPAMVVYNEDSTGYFHYLSACSATDTDTLTFSWKLSHDKKYIAYTNLNGDPTTGIVVLLTDYTYKNIRMSSGGKFGQRFLDGNYIAMPKE